MHKQKRQEIVYKTTADYLIINIFTPHPYRLPLFVYLSYGVNDKGVFEPYHISIQFLINQMTQRRAETDSV